MSVLFDQGARDAETGEQVGEEETDGAASYDEDRGSVIWRLSGHCPGKRRSRIGRIR